MQEEKLFCENCGKQLKPDAEFCPYCGAPVQRNPENPPNTAPPEEPLPPGGHRKLITAIVIGAVMVGAVAAGIFFIAPKILDSQGSDGSKTAAVSAASEKESAAASSVSSAASSASSVPAASVTASTAADSAKPGPNESGTAPSAVLPSGTKPAGSSSAGSSASTPAAVTTPAATATPAATITPAAVTPAPASGGSSFDADTADSYWWPESNTRYYSESDLEGKTAVQLHYIINEIYARRGYIFTKQEWRDYFSQKSWYHPTTSADQFSESVFNQYEKANIDLVNAYQAVHFPNDV